MNQQSERDKVTRGNGTLRKGNGRDPKDRTIGGNLRMEDISFVDSRDLLRGWNF